jgi:hypothetical protein
MPAIPLGGALLENDCQSYYPAQILHVMHFLLVHLLAYVPPVSFQIMSADE